LISSTHLMMSFGVVIYVSSHNVCERYQPAGRKGWSAFSTAAGSTDEP
jgi:hypothetical protein